MKFIKLPTVWNVTDDRLADLGIGTEKNEPGTVYINPLKICAVNDSPDENECVLRLSDGGSWRIQMPLKDLLKILSDFQY